MFNREQQLLCLSGLTVCLAGCVILKRIEDRRRRRRRKLMLRIRSRNNRKQTEGFFATLVKDMQIGKWNDEQFFNYCRITRNQFRYLVKLVKSNLQKESNLTAEHCLILTLHYLSNGNSVEEIAWGYKIDKGTACNVIKETCKVLWHVLSSWQLPIRNSEDWKNVAVNFYQQWNLPNCLGAVDSKHINIRDPNTSGSECFNYSITLTATCDANYRFMIIDIGGSGLHEDLAGFKVSGILEIPDPAYLPRTDVLMDHYIVGDRPFPLKENIICPYPGNNLSDEKNVYNYRIHRGRQTIENAFGILSARWQILRGTLEVSEEIAELIVQATVVLHNYLINFESDIKPEQRRYCPAGFTDSFDENGSLRPGTWRDHATLQSVNQDGSNNAAKNALQQRDILTKYFVSFEGRLPCREDYINRDN